MHRPLSAQVCLHARAHRTSTRTPTPAQTHLHALVKALEARGVALRQAGQGLLHDRLAGGGRLRAQAHARVRVCVCAHVCVRVCVRESMRARVCMCVCACG